MIISHDLFFKKSQQKNRSFLLMKKIDFCSFDLKQKSKKHKVKKTGTEIPVFFFFKIPKLDILKGYFNVLKEKMINYT